METLKIVLTVVHLVLCVAMVVIVLFQSGKSAGLSGAIAGAAESFLSKNKSKGLDAKLARGTKWVAIVLVVLTLALNLI